MTEISCPLSLRSSRPTITPQKAIKELHSYEAPEIPAMPIVSAGTAYRQWLEKELTSKEYSYP